MSTKVIVITSGVSWEVPDDFNPGNNTIHAIGGGGGGGGGAAGASTGFWRGGGGGKGGGYARRVNFNPGGRRRIPIQIGVGGSGGAGGTFWAPSGQNGGDGTPTVFDSDTYLCAPGGTGGVRGGSTGNGGFHPVGTAAGDVIRTGGNGGGGEASSGPNGGNGGGGGGAAGADANGANGSGATGGAGGGPNGGAGGGLGNPGGHGAAWTDTATGIQAGAGGGGGGGHGGPEGGAGGNGNLAGLYGAGGAGGGSGGQYSGSGGATAGGKGAPGRPGVIVIVYVPLAGPGGGIPSISNLSELRHAVTVWLNRPDFERHVPMFIRLAEADIRLDLQSRQVVVQSSFVIDGPEAVLPANIKFPRALYVEGTYGGRIEIVPPEEVVRLRALYPSGGRVPLWAAFQGDKVLVAPVPTSAVTCTLVYEPDLPPLENDNDTNWLLQQHPGAYLYAALRHASPLLRDDERVALWQSAYDEHLAKITWARDRFEYGGQPLVAMPRLPIGG